MKLLAQTNVARLFTTNSLIEPMSLRHRHHGLGQRIWSYRVGQSKRTLQTKDTKISLDHCGSKIVNVSPVSWRGFTDQGSEKSGALRQ
jgi:hypothetical protein